MIRKNGKNEIEKLFLLDSQTSVKTITDITKNEKNRKIISFDYSLHELLSNRNIDHEISDDFLSEDEIQTIQKKTYDYVEWYKEPEIREFLMYNEVNIGKLFYDETLDFLVGFLKKFFELQNIFTVYPNHSFITTSDILYKIAKIFSNSITLVTQSNQYNTTLLMIKSELTLKLEIIKECFLFQNSFILD